MLAWVVRHYEWRLMLDILKSFEQVATRFSPAVLIVPGLVLVILGLFTWLGGLGFRRVLLALVGAITGGLCAFIISHQNAAIAALSALVAALVAAVLQRLFTAVLLGAIAFAIAFLIVARPYLAEHQGTLIGERNLGRSDQTLTVRESLDVVRAYGLDLADGFKYAGRRLAPLSWAIAAAVGAGLLTLGMLFRHLGGALSCSILGTALVFVGLVLLLMFKRSDPVTHIENRAGFYGLALLGMAAFGTLEQLLLCRRADRERRAETKSRKAAPDKAPSKRTWRNK